MLVGSQKKIGYATLTLRSLTSLHSESNDTPYRFLKKNNKKETLHGGIGFLCSAKDRLEADKQDELSWWAKLTQAV